MIKIMIEINEKSTKEIKDILAKGIDIEVQELRKNASIAEKEASDYIREKLEIVREENVINKCKNDKNKEIAEMLKALFK